MHHAPQAPDFDGFVFFEVEHLACRGSRPDLLLVHVPRPQPEPRGGGGERTEYHPCVAWDRLAEICGQFLSKGQLVDVEGRLQTRQWDDDAGKRHWKTEVVVASLEMLSGRSKKEYAKEAQAVAEAPDGAPAANGDA